MGCDATFRIQETGTAVFSDTSVHMYQTAQHHITEGYDSDTLFTTM